MSSEASAGRGTAAAGSADDDEDAAKAGFRRRRAGLAAAYALPFAVAPFLDVDATSASFRGVSGPPCLCAVALDGQIQLDGWLGRLMQPFVRL